MPTAVSGLRRETDTGDKIRQTFSMILFNAATRINKINTLGVKIFKAPSPPKSFAFFNVIHVQDEHSVGSIRVFAFSLKRRGFTAKILLHLDEEDYLLNIDEVTDLEKDSDREVLAIKISSWLVEQFERWAR